MTINRLDAHQLEERLRQALADESLQAARQAGRQRFSPELSYGRHFGPPGPAAKPAAVMALLEPIRANLGRHWSIPLTVRPLHLPDHPGQVSLPGGRLEGKESYQAAAEREFCEEMGTQEFPGKVIGELSPLYVYNSDYQVRVFVAISPIELEYLPCQHEVEAIVHLPIRDLLDPSKLNQHAFSRGGVHWSAATIAAQQAVVWGATAIMLGELAALVVAMPA